MEKLLLVDGSNLLFQMFYGMPSRIVGKHGKLVHGTLGFVGALLKMLKNLCPTHVVVLFDGEHPNARCMVDEAYKANRPDFSQMPEEETPFSQLPDIYAALDFLKIQHAETCDCETDDLIASYALRFGGEMQVVISSFDSDFFQLVSERVSVLRYRGEHSVLCTPNYVRERYGVEPAQYADFKALVGDKADNIQGIKGVGAKTAAGLLSTFQNLENLLAHAEGIEKTSLRVSVIEGRERLVKNERLIRLKGEEKLPFSLSSLRYTPTLFRTGEVLEAIGVK